MAESTQAAKRVVHEYADLWNEKAFERIPEVVTESFQHRSPEAEVQGREEFEAYMQEFTTAFPDFRVEIQELTGEGDTVVAEGRYTMTHEGEFDGIPPTGKPVELPALAKFRVEDGKVAEHHEYHDQLAILEQLGVVEE